MILTMLLVGLVIGAFVHGRASVVRSAIIGVVISMLWGVVVGVADGSIGTFVVGAALALANVFVGAAPSACVRSFASLPVGERHGATR
jgi:hypothetical protein